MKIVNLDMKEICVYKVYGMFRSVFNPTSGTTKYLFTDAQT